ncbi:uncharacterized protein METZ01_LOCUS406567, partial [marine metagenome]
SWNGTSMACPHVAGVAALVWSYSPTLGGAGVKQVILDSADRLPNLTGVVLTGARLNALGALRASVPPTDRGIMSSYVPTGVSGWGLMQQTQDGFFEVKVGLDSNKTKHYRTSTLINDDKWYHLAYTYDANATSQVLTLYINGTKQVPTVISDSDLTGFTSNYQLNVGSDQNKTSFFPGTIDEPRIYDRALSEREVAELFLGEADMSLLPKGNTIRINRRSASLKTLGKTVTADRQSAPGGANLAKRKRTQQAPAKHAAGFAQLPKDRFKVAGGDGVKAKF